MRANPAAKLGKGVGGLGKNPTQTTQAKFDESKLKAK